MEYEYLEEALLFYNITESDVELLRHNENMTFRIGKDYLLQIHKHTEGFHTEHIYEGLDRIAVYEAEIKFLDHLKKQGMIIREPMKNRYGKHVTKLNNGTLVMVSKWIEGEALCNRELDEELCYKIGVLAAQLHKCTKGFQTYPVISYDEQHCQCIKERLQKLEEIGLNAMYSQIMQRACDNIGTSLQKVHDEFLLLHADLSPSNILITQNGLAAIDFSLFGMGHPMLDLANLFGNINGLTRRQKIAEGYRDTGGIIHYKALDACFIMTILDCIIIHFEQWSKEDWFEPRLKRWCQESFEPFVRGERIFADNFYLIYAKN